MPYQIYLRPAYSNELYHHGIKGQKWGVRRFQNPDGSLTAAGKKRYSTNANKAYESSIPQLKKSKTVHGHTRLDVNYSVDDGGLSSKEKRLVKKANKGRTAYAERELTKFKNTKEYRIGAKEAYSRGKGIRERRKLVKDYDMKVANDYVNRAKNLPIDVAIKERNRSNATTAAVVGAGAAYLAGVYYLQNHPNMFQTKMPKNGSTDGLDDIDILERRR